MNIYHEYEVQVHHEEVLRDAERRHRLEQAVAGVDGEHGIVARLSDWLGKRSASGTDRSGDSGDSPRKAG